MEHDPEQIWISQLQTIREALDRENLQSGEISAIGITNQRETTVLWDRRTGKPIYNAIVWQCRRTADFCKELQEEGFDARLREKTGLVTDAYFSGTKLKWILDHVPGARREAEQGHLAFGTIDSWLVNRLSGGAAANNLLCQFQADLLDIPVSRPKVLETTALGAAYLAGLAVGYWRDKEEISANWSVGREFHPRMSQNLRRNLITGWERAVARSKNWASPEQEG